jgi:ABC-2 type transport system permease protein
MIASLKSELRKLYTVRSTYLMLLFTFLIMLFFAFYTEGLKVGHGSLAATDPNKLAELVKNAVANLAFFGAIAGILSLTHEYRYNTIMYTLTSSRSRSQTLLAKVIAISIFAVLFTIYVAVAAAGLMYLGLAIKGVTLVHQTFPVDLLWRVLYMSWGTCMMGLLLAAYIRNQVGTIAAYFVLPGLGEMLAGLLLKDNKIYLPFTALQQVTGASADAGLPDHTLSHVHAAWIFGAYLVVGWIIAIVLFLRRDAN